MLVPMLLLCIENFNKCQNGNTVILNKHTTANVQGMYHIIFTLSATIQAPLCVRENELEDRVHCEMKMTITLVQTKYNFR